MTEATKRKTEVKKDHKNVHYKNIKLFNITWLMKIGKNQVYREAEKIKDLI